MENFWNWYLSLFSHSNPLVILGAWGTTLTTIGFAWKYLIRPLVNKFPDFSSKLEVTLKIDVTHTMASLMGNQNITPSLICQIVNKSDVDIHVRAPKLKLLKGLFSTKLFQITRSNNYPKKLGPGKELAVNYDLGNLSNSTLDQIGDKDSICLQVETTKFGKYDSDKINGERLKASFEQANVVINDIDLDKFQ